MRDEIESRFATNLERVQHLVDLYQGGAGGRGRRRAETTDVLRAAVVLLHATLEDFLRSILEWKLPEADAVHLKDVPLPGKKPRSTFTLDDLAPFRGASVDDVIVQSVRGSLDRSTFNHPGEVADSLERIGLSKRLLDPYTRSLAPMMQRRHWIVHRADRNPTRGRGHHPTRSLQRAAVEAWSEVLRQFGTAVLGNL